MTPKFIGCSKRSPVILLRVPDHDVQLVPEEEYEGDHGAKVHADGDAYNLQVDLQTLSLDAVFVF